MSKPTDVVNLDDRRPPQTTGYRTCTCGCCYFTVLHVTIGQDNRVQGYAQPRCAGCGKDLPTKDGAP